MTRNESCVWLRVTYNSFFRDGVVSNLFQGSSTFCFWDWRFDRYYTLFKLYWISQRLLNIWLFCWGLFCCFLKRYLVFLVPYVDFVGCYTLNILLICCMLYSFLELSSTEPSYPPTAQVITHRWDQTWNNLSELLSIEWLI